MRAGEDPTLHLDPPKVQDPTQLFFQRFMALSRVWLWSHLFKAHHPGEKEFDFDLSEELLEISGTLDGSTSGPYSIVLYKQLVQSGSKVILDAAQNPSYMAILWKSFPLALCEAAFIQMSLHCGDHPVAVQQLCSHSMTVGLDTLKARDQATSDESLLRLFAFAASTCATPKAHPPGFSLVVDAARRAFGRRFKAGHFNSQELLVETQASLINLFVASQGNNSERFQHFPHMHLVATGQDLLLMLNVSRLL